MITLYEKYFEQRARRWAAFTRTWGEEANLACAIERARKLAWQLEHGIAQHVIVSGRPYQYCRMIYRSYASRQM